MRKLILCNGFVGGFHPVLTASFHLAARECLLLPACEIFVGRFLPGVVRALSVYSDLVMDEIVRHPAGISEQCRDLRVARPARSLVSRERGLS